MNSYAIKIMEILKNYHLNKMKVENRIDGEILARDFKFINKSIKALGQWDYLAIKLVYIEKLSKKDAAKQLYVTRMTLDRRINRIVNQFAEVYERLISEQ